MIGLLGRTTDLVSSCLRSLLQSAHVTFLSVVLTKSVASDKRNGREWEIGDGREQREESGAVGSRVGVRLVQFQALAWNVRSIKEVNSNARCRFVFHVSQGQLWMAVLSKI